MLHIKGLETVGPKQPVGLFNKGNKFKYSLLLKHPLYSN